MYLLIVHTFKGWTTYPYNRKEKALEERKKAIHNGANFATVLDLDEIRKVQPENESNRTPRRL